MNIFLYGTLQDEALLSIVVCGASVERLSATLAGYHVQSAAEGHLPALKEQSGASANGVLLRDVTGDVLARIDAYEVPFGYVRVSAKVQVDGQTLDAEVYLPPADMQASGDWSLDAWAVAEREQSLIEAKDVAYFPLGTPASDITQFWGMIRSRAAAQVRARALPIAHSVRSHPRPARFTSEISRAGDFFRFSQRTVEYETFVGTSSGAFQREVFIGTDAAMVLPYDPVSDHVLLVEQIRMGPLAHGNPNPWCIEPIAGMIDGGETPQEAARREAREEAGQDMASLELMFHHYACSGNSTDYFYCYLGHADLPEAKSYFGGLEEEGEDIRIHVLPFEQALGLIDTGEINVGPTIVMLLWLDRNRARLRASA